MPKQKRKETQAEQSARFEAEVQRMIDAGELNPTEAAKALEKIIKHPISGGESGTPESTKC